MKYEMKNETHKQRSKRFKQYYEQNKEKMIEAHRQNVYKKITEFQARANDMRKKGGDESRKRFVQKRKDLKELAELNGFSIQGKDSLSEKDLDKSIEFFSRLAKERGKMKK